MNKDENQPIVCLTISYLKALIKECLREILAEEKQFSDVEYKALRLKAPPIEPLNVSPQCEKQTNTDTEPWHYFKLS